MLFNIFYYVIEIYVFFVDKKKFCMEINYVYSCVIKYIVIVVCQEYIKDELEKYLGDFNFILFESKVLERILWM